MTERELNEALRQYLSQRGIETEHALSNNGLDILKPVGSENLGLAIMVEVYNSDSGHNDIVMLQDLPSTLTAE